MSRKLLGLSLCRSSPLPGWLAPFASLSVALAAPAPEPATLTLTGDWQVRVSARNADGKTITATLDETLPALLTVKAAPRNRTRCN